jgi:hypothetical protein
LESNQHLSSEETNQPLAYMMISTALGTCIPHHGLHVPLRITVHTLPLFYIHNTGCTQALCWNHRKQKHGIDIFPLLACSRFYSVLLLKTINTPTTVRCRLISSMLTNCGSFQTDHILIGTFSFFPPSPTPIFSI